MRSKYVAEGKGVILSSGFDYSEKRLPGDVIATSV